MNPRRAALRALLLFLLLAAPAGALPPPEPARALERPARIFVVPWREVTDAERGFMDSFARASMPVEFTVHETGRDPARVREAIRIIRETRPDLVYCFGTTAAKMIAGLGEGVSRQEGIADLPIVFCIVSDPLAAGLVPDLARPGGNVTGVPHLAPFERQLSAMREALPFRRLGAVYNPAEQNSALAVDFLEREAGANGYVLIRRPVPLDPSGKAVAAALPATVGAMLDEKPDLVYIPSDSFLISNLSPLVAAVHARGIPTFSATEDPVRRGGALMGLVAGYYSCGLFAGHKAREILLEGKSPGEVPVETLRRFTFAVNMDAARALGVWPPLQLLRVAELIEAPKTKETP